MNTPEGCFQIGNQKDQNMLIVLFVHIEKF